MIKQEIGDRAGTFDGSGVGSGPRVGKRFRQEFNGFLIRPTDPGVQVPPNDDHRFHCIALHHGPGLFRSAGTKTTVDSVP